MISRISLVFLALEACSRASPASIAPTDANPPPPTSNEAAVPAPSSARDEVPLPPYDLPADIQARSAAAGAEFHASAAPTIERDVFLFFDADHGGRFEATLSVARRALSAYFAGPFAKGPDRAVSVYVFSTHDAYLSSCGRHHVARCERDLGSYQGMTREIFVDVSRGESSIAHEIVHPIVQTDAPALPLWIGEGLGSLFEAPRFSDDGSIHGVTNWRLPRLQRALTSAKESASVTLGSVLALQDSVFQRKDVALPYAMSRFLCQWLDERGQLWAFYAKWRASAAQDPAGVAALSEVLGESLEDATVKWRAWLNGLRWPAQ
jgi:hypothetical protein